MPLIRREAPAESEEAVRGALAHFAGVPQAQLHALQGTQPDQLAPTVPHEVFNLGLDDLRAGGRALASSQGGGWRYLLEQDAEVVASAETVAGPGGGTQFSHFNSGPFVAGTTAALAVAEGLPQTTAGSFELRLLHVPALYTMALWLHGKGDDDLLVPLAPTQDGIEANRAYPAAELLDILAERARQVPALAPDDTRGG
jgi:hypothetical protein